MLVPQWILWSWSDREASQFRCDNLLFGSTTGVSTSFEVGGWKTKVGGCDEARGQRPRGTRGVWGHAPTGNV